jgi:hypothetical protein
MKEGRQFK